MLNNYKDESINENELLDFQNNDFFPFTIIQLIIWT